MTFKKRYLVMLLSCSPRQKIRRLILIPGLVGVILAIGGLGYAMYMNEGIAWKFASFVGVCAAIIAWAVVEKESLPESVGIGAVFGCVVGAVSFLIVWILGHITEPTSIGNAPIIGFVGAIGSGTLGLVARAVAGTLTYLFGHKS